MDLLRVANQINAELAHLRANYSYLLDDQQRAEIFNSIVTCITNDLVDTITLSIRDCRDQELVFVSWEYDLSDKKYPRRNGPALRDILQILQKAPQCAYVTCEVEWSDRFAVLDDTVKRRILGRTFWSKQPQSTSDAFPVDRPLLEETRSPRSEVPTLAPGNFPSDLSLLECELLKIASETKLLRGHDVRSILASARECISNNLIRGLRFEVSDRARQTPILEWAFEITSDGRLVRKGDHLDQIVALAKKKSHHLLLRVWPLTTLQFEQLTPGEKKRVMRKMVWRVRVKRRRCLLW